MNKKHRYLWFFLSVLLLFACSTQKDAFLNRTYHGMTAKYNGYFNANELLILSIANFEKSRKEDFYQVLPIQPAPNLEESKAMYAAIDTAVVKCSKVIRNHSMPSAEFAKEAEYNPWIDENWMTIGKAFYYRREYEKALKNFQFVKRFFQKDPSKYISELWMAKIYIEQNRLTEAKSILDELQLSALEQKKKNFKSRFVNKKKLQKEDDFKPEMNQKIQFEIFKTTADLYVRKKQPDVAIFSLSEAIKRCKNKKEKTRLSFILGQLYQSNNNIDSAIIAFNHSISPAALYDISFNGKLNSAMLGSTAKDTKALEKMLRDAKNAPFKDQIYYAKAQVEQNKGNLPIAKSYLTLSAFYSTANKRQKARSYEKLGDISFSEKSYLNAQKYYDSCAKAMPEDYPNAEVIRSKATKLANLVAAMEIAQYEDSVQRISKMSDKDQTAFIKDVIKQMKEDAQRRKELEAAKMRALQDQANGNAQPGQGGKWVFNNQKLRDEGYADFRKQWGDRKNEDDWRRAGKMGGVNENLTPKDSLNNLANNATPSEKNTDTLDVESLRKNLPLTDSLYNLSVRKEIEARYTAGSLYKELLNENALAAEQYAMVIDENTRNLTDLSSAFQLFKLNENNAAAAEKYKAHILKNYPNSDVANYFKDPDFFQKVKENKIKSEKEYLAALHDYEMREYRKVIETTEPIVLNDKTNAFRAEYMLLNAMALGQITADKQLLVPKLKNLIDEKQGTPQAIRAKELLDILAKGTSKFEAYKPKSNGMFVYNDSVPQLILVLLDEEEDVEDLKSEVSDFVTKVYKKSKLKITTAMTLKETKMVLVSDLKGVSAAQDFINLYKSSFEQLGDFQNNKIKIITQENLKKLIESDNFEAYNQFYDLNY